jgi:hypothetical protein
VGIALNANWYEARPSANAREAKANEAAAARMLDFTLGWFARPLTEVGPP